MTKLVDIKILSEKDRVLYSYTTNRDYVLEILSAWNNYFITVSVESNYFNDNVTYYLKLRKEAKYIIGKLTKENLQFFIKHNINKIKLKQKAIDRTLDIYKKYIYITFEANSGNQYFIKKIRNAEYKHFIANLFRELKLTKETIYELYKLGKKERELVLGVKKVFPKDIQRALKKIYQIKSLDTFLYDILLKCLNISKDQAFSKYED